MALLAGASTDPGTPPPCSWPTPRAGPPRPSTTSTTPPAVLTGSTWIPRRSRPSPTGNAAAATLPLQLARAVHDRRLTRGDTVALFGLASGASAGVALLRR
ncbi:3-oxoacyl-[acyl-carrier-protein] synthase III C-terminal domain-containing protein [Streptomyces sp. R-07]|uniref:3-oxoacyl-[acyl-carrier-protein] synthase III C-terminal domain-containing protein n=1 Tax=Streptomyces sp. R-07 TaxID=3404052 RepID=UPI003CEE0D70